MDRHRDTTSIDGTPLPPPAPRGTPAIRLDLVRSVRLHPVLAASVAAVTFVLIAGFALTRKPMYKAEALVYVEPITAKILSDGSEGLFDATRYESYLQQQIQTVQRPDILQAAVESLPIGYWHFPGESTANAAQRLGNSLKVERQGTSFQVSLSLMGPDPVGTAAAVNAVTTAYLQKGRKDETTRTDGRVQLLEEERDRLTAELKSDRTEQVALGSTLGVANPVGPTADAYDTELSGIRAELVSARQAHDVAAARLASVTGPAGGTGMAAIATENTAGDPGLQALKTSFAQRRAALTSELAGLTPGNPIYKQRQAELAQLDQQLAFRASLAQNASSQQLRDRLSLELKRTGDIEARLNGQLAHATAQATNAAPKLQRATELEANIERLQARYATVDNALRGLLLEANGPGVVHLSVPATPPLAPEPSRRSLLLLASVPLALLFGGIAAVLARRRAGRVYTEDDLEPILGFTPIGSMPYAASLTSGEASDDLLRLAAGLERAHRRTGVQTFVFTAASVSTDITAFVAAMSRELERLGFRTKTQATGELLRAWDSPTTESEVLVAGMRQGIGARLDALKQRTDFVLLEAPPLLHSAETEYFLSAADVTVLLIESGVTTERELCPAMDLLRKLRVGGLAAVLLNVPSEPSAYSVAPARSYDRLAVARPEAARAFHEEVAPIRDAAPKTRFEAAPPPVVTEPAMSFTEPPAAPALFFTEQPASTAKPASTPLPKAAPVTEIFNGPAPVFAPEPQTISAPVAARTIVAEPAPPLATPPTIEVAPVMKASAQPDPEPDFDPDPPPSSKIRRLFNLFHHEREPVNPFSFIPSTWEESAPEPASQTPLEPHTPAPIPQPAAGVGAPHVAEALTTTVAPAQTSASTEHAPAIAFSETPASVTASTTAPSMLHWEARIPGRIPAEPESKPSTPTAFTPFTKQYQSQSTSDASRLTWKPFDGFRPFESLEAAPVAPEKQEQQEEQKVLAEPIGELPPLSEPKAPAPPPPALESPAPPSAVRPLPIVDKIPESPLVEPAPSPIEALVAAAPEVPREPRRLPSSAERLAFRPSAPSPRRPSLPAVPGPQPGSNPTAPRRESDPWVPISPHLVAAPRPTSKSLSAEQVAERIVSTSAPRRNYDASRPHIMPARPEATAGRRWAMLSRFSKNDPAAEPVRDALPRDRAAG